MKVSIYTSEKTKSNSTWKLNENGKPMRYMKCVRCFEWKPRTTDYFTANNFDNGILYWFQKSIPGYENLRNSSSRPCNVCFAKMTMEKGKTEYERARKLTVGYINLHPSQEQINEYVKKYPYKNPKQTPAWWFIITWENFKYDRITGLPKHLLTTEPNHDYRVGINSLVISDKKYSKSNHFPETTEICVSFANVQQGNMIHVLDWSPLYSNFIKYISDEYNNEIDEKIIIDIAIKNWKNPPRKNGITAKSGQPSYSTQLHNLHLKAILGVMVHGGLREDKRCKRKNPYTYKELLPIYFNMLIEQKFRCEISKMIMTIENGPYRFSFDRIDNNIAHIPENLQVICRIFNSGNGGWMSLKRFMFIMLNQKLIELSNDEKEKIQYIHDEI